MITHIFNKDQRLIKAAIFFSIASLFVSSCKKVESNLGLDELPGEQLNTLVDTLQLNTYSLLEDSLKTDELSNNMIGSYTDPVVGTTTASIYAELKLTETGINFGNSPVVDSVVLSMKLKGHYGYENNLTFHVYKLTEDIYRDSTYYSSTVKTNDGMDLVTSMPFTPSLTNTPIINGDTLDPQIRIQLNNAFGTSLINDSIMLDSDDSLHQILKGFYITVDQITTSGVGGVYAVELEDVQSNVTVFFHNTTDTSSFKLRFTDRAARFTHFDHDYSLSEVQAQLSDSTLGNEFFYLQAGHGLVANVCIPDLASLQNDGPVSINKAELYLPVQYYSIDPLSPPTRIIAYGLDENDDIFNMTDIFVLNSAIYGGGYDDTKKAYVFNMVRHVQEMLTGERPNKPIRLAASSSSVSVNRVILSGKNSPNREKPYLKIYYTKL